MEDNNEQDTGSNSQKGCLWEFHKVSKMWVIFYVSTSMIPTTDEIYMLL